MNGLAQSLESLWVGTALHLWQTALFLLLLATVARVLHRAPARLLDRLYWVGMAKLLLPLPWLGPWLDRAVSTTLAGDAPGTGRSVVSVVMFPSALAPEGAGGVGLPPAFWVALTAAWACAAAWALQRGVRRGSRTPGEKRCPDELRDRLRAALRGTPLSAEAVHVAADAPTPCVQGLRRPTVVLPDAILRGLEEGELRAVLLHEAEHVRMRDPLRYALLAVVQALFWFYPPAWWLARRIRETSELACDESVLRAGTPAAVYRRSLARTLTLGLERHAAAGVAGILGHRRSLLRRRLERIRSGRRLEIMFVHRCAIGLVALAAVALSFIPAGPALRAAGGPARDDAALQALAEPDQPVLLQFKQATAEQVFGALERATGVTFRLAGEFPDRRFDAELPRAALTEALLHLRHVAGVRYDVVGPRRVDVYPVLLSGRDGVEPPQMIAESRVMPVIPAEAREARIAGRVILQAIIDRQGRVAELETLQVEPADYTPFVEAATEAVSQWRFEPALKDGQPVPVYFTFVLQFDPNNDL